MPKVVAVVLICLTFFTSAVAKAEAPVGRRLMFFEYGQGGNRFIELDRDGKITREFAPLSTAVIFQALPNGNLLYAYGGNPTGVIEINPKGETVWNYISKCPQVLSCERLPNGNTLVGEQGPCQVVEVDPKGQIVQTTPVKSADPHYHQQLRNIHKLKNGNILAAHESDGAVREYSPDGKIVWEYDHVENTGDAIRLADGNTLIACGTQKRLIIVTPEKKVVWEFKAEDAPELNLTWIASLQLLKNGNFLIGNFIRGAEGKGVHAFEITPEKKVVWTFADHARFKSTVTFRAPDEQR